jgi:hypothetical protein
MSDETADLQRWSAQWQSQPAGVAAEELRQSVMRETRMLRIGLILPVMVTLGIGGSVIANAATEGSVAAWVMAAGVWLFIASTWAVCLFLARGTWRPRAETTAAFVEVSVQRCESALAAVPVASVLYVVQAAFVIAWKTWYGHGDLADVLLATPTIILVWIGLPVFGFLMARYRRRKQSELDRLRALRKSLLAE